MRGTGPLFKFPTRNRCLLRSRVCSGHLIVTDASQFMPMMENRSVDNEKRKRSSVYCVHTAYPYGFYFICYLQPCMDKGSGWRPSAEAVAVSSCAGVLQPEAVAERKPFFHR